MVLKGVVTLEEWDQISEHIQYDFVADNYFSELKEQEIMNERMALVAQMDPFAGKYFSLEYMRRQILRQTDEEFNEIQNQMDTEIQEGKLVDPVEMQKLEVAQMEMSLMPPEPDPAEAGISPADYKKGDI